MTELTRREFLRFGAYLGAMMGLGGQATSALARSVETLVDSRPPVLWLHGLACSGCSVSLLNSEDPDPLELLTRHIHLNFHATLSTATGHVAVDALERTIDAGDFILVVEGSIPSTMPEACRVNHEPIGDLVLRAVRRAKQVDGPDGQRVPLVVATGTCAAFGGVPAAEHNPTGARDVQSYLAGRGQAAQVVNLPGCPVHPDWIVGTLAYLLGFGLPALDDEGRPTMFYGKTVHDQCPRFADYEREKFAEHFGDEGCLFKLGCIGPETYADCTVRNWNGGASDCIKAGAPCIGCAARGFGLEARFPMYRMNPAFPKIVAKSDAG